MERNLERLRKNRGPALLAVLLLTVGMVVLSPIAAAVAGAVAGPGTTTGAPAMGRTITVWPNGVNDTSDLQSAIDHCTGMMSRCTIQLEKGTYFTDQLVAYGFRGTFTGMGEGQTILQALPNLPSPAPAYNTTTSSYIYGFPGPQNPWPILITFINGSFTMSGMTLKEPYSQPTMGWKLGETNYTGLWALIEVNGWQAHATFDELAFYGASGDLSGFNIGNTIQYSGTFVSNASSSPPAQYPLLGTFTVKDCYFNDVDTAVWLYNAHVRATIEGTSTVYTEAAYGYNDISSSTLTVRDSSATRVIYGAGFLALESYYRPATGPVMVVLQHDTFYVSKGANGMDFFDFGTPSTLSVVATGNLVRTNPMCGCYNTSQPSSYSAIIVYNTVSAKIQGNRIVDAGAGGIFIQAAAAGIFDNRITGSYVGIWLYNASYSHVRNNMVSDSTQYGIALETGTSYTMVVHNLVQNSGVDDLYWDQTGTGNVWAHNMYMTSSPGGLSWGHY